MNFIYIVSGLILLVLGGNWLLKSAIGLSIKLKISKIIVGLTVVSFATSAPEMIVSIKAALSGYSDIALGNIVGSNIANIGLVLGIVLLINAIQLENSFLKIDWPVTMITTVLLFVFLIIDGVLSRTEGFIFIIVLIIYLLYLIKNSNKVVHEDETNPDVEIAGKLSNGMIFFFLLLGGVGLWLGSELLVNGAVNLAENLGVSKRVIAITVVSVGTSIPELASSIIASIKKENAISIGNIIGSNIFNILSVLGITVLIKPIDKIDVRLLEQDVYWMLGFAFVLLPLAFLPKRNSLSFKEGIVLLLLYFIFVYSTIS
ncbi:MULTISPECIES: calcium/sodium antiporter [unclassified Flavobacterium]|uniref:calcium/sodium antiporter n=1 Tax=unclassified Flavobacterium TaxID=196869 RepID=UPI001291969A|nr:MULTISPECIES: calcium/sodium antiporter [unclassified Flavobacterium]MQP52518.1 calcium/sodium antiporter [Flavobacterium sp. LMO9]MQP62588.1 calcium/sodium antiporter [Flavobacterium sp. LMO6]